MMGDDAKPAVPAHLRRFVVEQDYEQYDAVDQAVWRFVLLQTYSRLVETAHPTYREGLAATGISVERIPRIAEMNDRLSRFGWGAVCVDGFIPPRAFQEFQAHGLLPIAADIRTRQHLAYTPAPDIIHEAAGHAPILPHPVYAAFLRRIGELGAQAFTVPEEERVFQAIHDLSEAKEDLAYGPDALARAESELEAALASVTEPSEGARLSRLYWWTAEYGLVGQLDDYKIYGAGLLSSLGESYSCHDGAVRKLPLDDRCMDVAYDITRTQPQLFVVRSFEALHEVLDAAERRLAAERAGGVALQRAWRSGEVASFGFSGGTWVIGTLSALGPRPAAPAWLELSGRCAIAWNGARGGNDRRAGGPASENGGQIVLLGPLSDGGRLETLTDADVEARRAKGDQGGRQRRFLFASGALVEGTWERTQRDADGRLRQIDLSDASVTLPGAAPRWRPRFALWAVGEMAAIRAGSVDDTFHPETTFSAQRVPRLRPSSAGEQRLLKLYQQARAAAEGEQDRLLPIFSHVHAQLSAGYPDEWLLRWNLLESLGKARPTAAGELPARLRGELERLEERFERRQPIASGLRYLGQAG